MWDTIIAILLVGAGGGAGAVLRHSVSTWAARLFRHGAFGTFAINLTGCFVIGIAAGLAAGADGRPGVDGAPWLLLVTGVLGSYTTVSSFSLQTLTMLREGRINAAFVNIGASLLLCLSATVIGFALAYGLGTTS